VAKYVQTLVSVECDDREITRFVERAAQISELSVQSDRYCGPGETGTDGLRDLKTGDTIGVLENASVWITKL
jgi:hypothetical protein